MDYWTREKNDAAAAAAGAAAAAAAAAAAKSTAADAKAAKATAAGLKAESAAVHAGLPAHSGPEYNSADVREKDWKASATDISDNTHIGEHWDGPKRGRIIRDYRKSMDGCNISGTSKCTEAALKKNY